MKYLIRANIVVWALVISMSVFADPPNNRPPDNRPPDRGNPHGEVQSTNTNRIGVTSNPRSTANAGATSNSGGNSLSTGDSRSSSSAGATGGTATATGGDAIVNEETSTNVTYNTKYPVSTPASLFIQACQRGMSGQLESGGFSVAHSDQFCDYLRLAAVMREAYEWEMRDCKCEGVCTTDIATVELTCNVSAEATQYLALYHENINKANALIDSTDETALAERVAGQLTIPIVTLLALLWIL